MITGDSFNDLLAVSILLSAANLACWGWLMAVVIENRKLREQLFQREKWHERELRKLRERL